MANAPHSESQTQGESARHDENTESSRQAPGSDARPLFGRFAERASDFVSRGAFFAACVLVVLVWLPTFPLFADVEAWQLPINTLTTIVTFLLVALLQNSQRRSEAALQHKLDALADGLADLMDHQLDRDPGDLSKDTEDLRRAVGLEQQI